MVARASTNRNEELTAVADALAQRELELAARADEVVQVGLGIFTRLSISMDFH